MRLGQCHSLHISMREAAHFTISKLCLIVILKIWIYSAHAARAAQHIVFIRRGTSMSKKTSSDIGSLAGSVLNNPNSSKIQRTLAGSALSQTGTSSQTSGRMEAIAGRVLQSDHYSDVTHSLAASVLAQSKKWANIGVWIWPFRAFLFIECWKKNLHPHIGMSPEPGASRWLRWLPHILGDFGYDQAPTN